MTIFDVIQADETVEAVLVIGEEIGWLEECQFMLQSVGLPSFGACSAADAFARIASPSISTVIIDQSLRDVDSLGLAEELALRAAASGRELNFILAAEHATLDVVVAAMRASVVDVLEKPITREDLRKALLRTRGVKPDTTNRKALASKLTTLSLEIQRLSTLMEEPAPTLPCARGFKLVPPEGGVTSEFIRDILRKEAQRCALFHGGVFGDPAWAVMLDLLAAKIDGHTVSVSSACIASGAPTTTALRLINRLIAENYLERVPDAHDRRRDFLTLSTRVEVALIGYLESLIEG